MTFNKRAAALYWIDEAGTPQVMRGYLDSLITHARNIDGYLPWKIETFEYTDIMEGEYYD